MADQEQIDKLKKVYDDLERKFEACTEHILAPQGGIVDENLKWATSLATVLTHLGAKIRQYGGDR